MASEQNWRIEQNASDYFGHQKKAAQIESRRPVQKVSDVVGPALGPNATRLIDFNDAVYSGYYSALPGVANGPTVFASTLSAALSTSGTIISMSIAALTGYVKQGQQVQVATVDGAHSQVFTAAWDHHPGTTTLYVLSATPTFAFPIGAKVTALSPLVAETVQDNDLGGVQRVWVLDQKGVTFERVYLRSAYGGSVFWGSWVRVDVEDTKCAFVMAQNYGAASTVPTTATDVPLSGLPAATHKSNNYDTYFTTANGQYVIKRPGLYTITAWTRLGPSDSENQHIFKIQVGTIVTQPSGQVDANPQMTVTVPVDDTLLANNGSVNVVVLMTPAASVNQTTGYYAISIARVGGIN